MANRSVRFNGFASVRGIRRRVVASIACSAFLLQLTPAFAQSAPVNLDLTATTRTVSPELGGQSVTIYSGGTIRTVTPQSVLTPAENLAVMQVLNTGQQTVQIGAQGNATGGRVSFAPSFVQDISSLVIPKGVTSVANSTNLNISGTLANSGNLYFYSTVGNHAAASINAANIYNSVGALISSVVPSSVLGGVPSAGRLDLSLSALQSITNHGTIRSSGSLNLTAGQSIVNTGTVQSVHDLGLNSGSISNSSLMSSSTGNINITHAGHIAFNNSNGSLEALLGNINVRDAAFAAKSDFIMTGGDVLSNSFNIWSGTGKVDVNIQDLTGVINVSAGEAHVLSNTKTLQLGTMNIVGDPTYFNTGGGISINSAITTNGNALAIIANGDITTTGSASIDASLGSGGGGNILIMSGAQFTISPATASGSSTSSGQNGGNGDTTTTLTITGGSITGGMIDLSNATAITSTGGAGAGGNISIIAFGGTGAGSGTVTLPNGASTPAVQTAGTGAPNGNVFIIAGAKSGTSITTGAIDTSNSGSGVLSDGGQVILVTASPKVTGTLTVLNGIANGGSVVAGQLQPASISINGDITTHGAPLLALSGANVSIGGNIITGGSEPTNGLVPGDVAIISRGNISTSASGLSIDTAGIAGNNGGNILMIAGAAVKPFGPLATDSLLEVDFNGAVDTINSRINIVGGSAGGGSIDLTGGGSNDLSTLSTAGAPAGATGYKGGSLTLLAFGGSGSGSGTVTTPSSLVITTGGSHDGTGATNATDNNNGDVTILAGGQSGTTISIGDINTTGSNSGGGNVTIATAAPTAGLPVTYVSGNAGITSGSIAAGPLQAANAQVGAITASGGYVELPPPPLGLPQNLSTTVSVRAGQNLSIGDVANYNNTMANGLPSSDTRLSAGGVMTLTGTSIDASAAAADGVATQPGRNGGTISLTATSYSLSQTVTVSSNGTSGFDVATGTGGDGGVVSITSIGSGSGTNASAITVGADNFQISAVGDSGGGNGGTVNISSGTNITIDPTMLTAAPQVGANSTPDAGTTAFNTTGTGATINLTAGTFSSSSVPASGTVFIDGALDASGAASQFDGTSGNPGGNGGAINITMNSSTPFNIGGASSSSANGSTGTLSANGNVVDSGTSGAVAAYGSGGSITVKNLGTGGIVVQSGSLEVQAAAAAGQATVIGDPDYGGGNGGTISLTATNGTVLSNGNLDASGGASGDYRGGGDGGTIQIYSNSASPFIIGNVSGMVNGVNASVTAISAVGGTATGASANIVFETPGSGGTISITNAGKGGVYIDTSATFSVAAAPASGTLGTFGGQGGKIVLNAPAGPVLSMLPLDASGGAAATAGPYSIQANISAGSDVVIQLNSTTGLAVGQTVDVQSTTSRETPVITNVTANTITVSTLVNAYTTSDNVVANFPAGFGGSISITSKSTNKFMVGTGANAPKTTIGTGNGVNGSLTANGFSGGSVSVVNDGTGGIQIGSGNLTVTATAPAATIGGNSSGLGGSITLKAPFGPVGILGGLDVSGSSGSTTAGFTNGGSAGTILIVTGSTKPFLVGGLSGTSVNGSASPLTALGGVGIATSGNGGSITIVNQGTGGIQVASGGLSVAAAAATSSAAGGDGGVIALQSANGAVTSAGALDASGGAGNATQPDGMAGSISITTKTSAGFKIGGTSPSVPSLTANGWNGGQITVVNSAAGGIIVASGALLANPEDASSANSYNGGPGGNISLQATAGSVLVNGTLSANGGAADGAFAGGDGGQLVFVTKSTTPFAIGGATKNGITTGISANGVFGGTINVIALGSGGITIADTSAITVTAADATATLAGGDGGNIYLQALAGNVFIGGNLDASGGTAGTQPGGAGGVISITTKSTKTFNLGAAVAGGNGIAGTLSATGVNGGSIGVSNQGTGGITFAPANILVTALSQTFAGGTGGTIDLQAPAGTLQNSAAGTLSADAVNNSVIEANGGKITLAAKTINTSAGALKLSAEADPGAAQTATGGLVSITQTSTTTALTVGNSSNLVIDVDGSPAGNGGAIMVTAPGGITVSGRLTSSTSSLPNTGSIYLATSGKGTISGSSQPISTGTLTMTSSTGGIGVSSPVQTSTEKLVVASEGAVQIANTGTLEILSAVATKGALSISNTGSITVSGPVSSTGKVTLSALSGSSDSDLVINGNVSGSTVSLQAEGTSTGGQISGSGLVTATANGAGAITLTAGFGGIDSLNTSTAALTIIVDGNAGSTNVSVTNKGNLQLSLGTSENFNELEVIVEGSLLTVGAINMADKVTLSTNSLDANYSIALGGAVGSSTASEVNIFASGSLLQPQTTSVIQAQAVNLSSIVGNLGTSASPLQINTSALALGTDNGGSAIIVNAGTSLTLGGVLTGGDFSISTNGQLNVSANVVSRAGAVSLINTNTSTGAIVVNSASLPTMQVTGTMGPVTIQNNNLSGAINILANTTLTGNARNVDGAVVNSQSGVSIISGPFPASPVAGTTPTNVTVNTAGSFQAFFGPGFNATGAVVVNATGANAVFNGNTGTTINMDAGVVINASGTTQALSSLDLTNKTLVQAIATLQTTPGSGVTGTLNQSGGVVSGGNIILAPSVSLINLAGLNIPASVTVTFAAFNESSPVVVNVPSSATKNPILAGDLQFVGTNNFNTDGRIFINSALPGTTTLSVSSAGSIVSDNHLLLSVGGSVTMAGALTAGTDSNLKLLTSNANGPSKFTATSAPAGTVTLTGKLTAGTAANLSQILIQSSGSILQTAGSITGGNVILGIGGANGGAAFSRISAKTVNANSLSFQAGSGATILATGKGITISALNLDVDKSLVTVSQLAALTLSGTTLDKLALTANAGIATSANVSCGSCVLTTSALTNLYAIEATDVLGTITITSPTTTSLTVTGASDVLTGSIAARSGLTISTKGNLTVDGGLVSTINGALSLTSTKLGSISNVTMNAGTLASSYFSGVLSPTDVATSGNVSINGGTGLSINAFVQSVNGNVQVSAATGNLTINGSYEAFGGSLLVLAKGTVSGTSPVFSAFAIGTAATNGRGGGIDIASGSSGGGTFNLPTGARLAAAFDLAPGSVPQNPVYVQVGGGGINPLGSNVAINNLIGQTTTTGVIAQNLASGGLINLSTSGTNVSTLDLNGGAIVFSSIGAKTSVQFDGAYFTVNAFRPIMMKEQATVALSVQSSSSSGRVAHVLMPGHTRVQALTGDGLVAVDDADTTSGGKGTATVAFNSGSMFLNPTCDAAIRAPYATVYAKKGSLVSVVVDDSGLRVAACSGPDHIRIEAGDKTITLLPGEEILISDTEVAVEQHATTDGIGRRAFKSYALGGGLHASICDVSLISILANAAHLQSLRQPQSAIEKKIANNLLRNAAALTVVTGNRGAYQARPKSEQATKANVFKAVRYESPAEL